MSRPYQMSGPLGIDPPAWRPPSTVMQMPVMNEARADTRKHTTIGDVLQGRDATQLVRRLAAAAQLRDGLTGGLRLLLHQRVQRSVRVAAGETAVTRMFDGAPRSARPFVKFMSAALAAPPVR